MVKEQIHAVTGDTKRLTSILLLSVSVLVGGCCTTTPSTQPHGPPAASATSDWIREAFRSETARRQFVQDMMDEAYHLPDSAQKAAAVLIASDRATEEVGKTSRAINTAIDIVIDNVRNADATGFKAVTARESRMERRPALLARPESGQHALNAHQTCDLGIQGAGNFFAVKYKNSPSGIAYTRCGTRTANSVGNLIVNIGDCYQLVPPITVPTNATDISVDVSRDGPIREGQSHRQKQYRSDQNSRVSPVRPCACGQFPAASTRKQINPAPA